MKAKHFSDIYLPARFAPQLLCIALMVWALSMFWDPSLYPVMLVMGIVAGALVFLFHFLRWRTDRQGFQVLAMISGLAPLFLVLGHHPGVGKVQYIVSFFITYTVAVLIYRRDLREKKMNA